MNEVLARARTGYSLSPLAWRGSRGAVPANALGAGWTSTATFVDAQNYFSVHALRAKDRAI